MREVRGLILRAALGLPLSLSAAQAAPLCRGCNIAIVSFDALQASHVHCLGYPRAATPTMDALAKQGALFTQAISAAPWTVPATMSWFTGTYPSLHKVVNKFAVFTKEAKETSNLKKLSPDITTLTEALKADGYATGGFTGDAGVNGVFGFSQGFDVYSDSVPAFSGMEQSIPKALAWLDGVRGRKFFLFLHGYDVHGQAAPAGGYDRRFVDPKYDGRYDGSPGQQRDLREKGLSEGRLDLREEDLRFWRAIYDEKLARVDAAFGRFMKTVREKGLMKNTIFVLASDHGTELGEHGRLDHGFTLYDEAVRVPLILIVPGMSRGQVISKQVSTIDLMPTLLELVGAKASEKVNGQLRGKSLVPLLQGKGGGRDVLTETDYRLYTHKRALRTAEGMKLIRTLETHESELYDLRKDPHETDNLIKKKPALAHELEERLFARYRELGLELSDAAPPTGCSPVYGDQCR